MSDGQAMYTMLELAAKTGAPSSVIREYVESGKIRGVQNKRGYNISAEEAARFAEMVKDQYPKVSGKRGRPPGKPSDTPKISANEPAVSNTMLGIPNHEIFEFLMKLIGSVRDDKSNPQYGQFSIKSDREILIDIMNGNYEIAAASTSLGVAPGTMVYNMTRAMIVGMGAAMKEMVQRVDIKTEITDEQIDEATTSVLKILL